MALRIFNPPSHGRKLAIKEKAEDKLKNEGEKETRRYSCILCLIRRG